MKRSAVAVFLAVVLFVFAAASFAQADGSCAKMGMGGGMDGKMMMSPKMVLAMASELNLTTDQMERLKKITDETPAKGAVKDDMKADMEAMKAEMQKDTPDEAKINTIMDKMADNHKAAMKNRLKTVLAVHAILTKEQREILKKKMEEKKENMGKHMGNKKDMKNK